MTEKEFIDQRYRDLESLNKRRWGWLQWLVVSAIGLISFGISVPACRGKAKIATMLQASNNARQIVIALKSYAGDHDWRYPTGATSNEAFRLLIREGLSEGWIEDRNIERIFTSQRSPFVGDNDIGLAPNFLKALEPGENHWAMTKGLTDNSSGNFPLVFENPAVASWPPQWDINVAGQSKPGRAWKGGKIVIARNDGTVNIELLGPAIGPHATLASGGSGQNLFEQAGPHEVLNVAK